MPKPRIMFWHDGRHPLVYMYEPPMQKEEYEAAVDELAGTPVEAIVFCLGDGRTVLHDTKVGEVWGHNVDKWSHLVFHRAGRNAKGLIDEGNDPLRIVCERAHQKGMLFYPSLFAQQPTDLGSGRVSNFRLHNRHLEIGAAGDLDRSQARWKGLDFKHQEVRDERFALIEETLNNYEVDGFELHLVCSTRFFYYFHPKEIDAGRAIMTEWVGKIYEAVKQSGPERELAIRIPASVEACTSQGLDIDEWVRQGIVDVINGESLLGDLIDPLADFRPFVELVKGTNCRFHASIHNHVDSDRLSNAPIAMMRAAATNYWAQGVDGLLLDHWFGEWPYQSTFYEKLREVPHADVMDPKDKYYHIPTTTNGRPEPFLAAQQLVPGLSMQLPADLEAGAPVQLDLSISDDLPRWEGVGRVHEVILRFRVTSATELDRLTFKLNGKELPNTVRRTINRMYTMAAPRYRVGGYWYVFRLDREHWPAKGPNKLEVTLLERDPEVTPQAQLRDVELEVKYLRGKHFHRGFMDPDLGPYDREMM